jgi:hypothetical protein
MATQIHGQLISDPELFGDLPGLTLPGVEAHTYVLVDDDAKECRIISEDELEASYVDNHIDGYQLQDVNSLTGLDPDSMGKEYLTITYSSGAQISLQLGLIDFLSAPVRTEQYAKSDGIIYPVDDSGTLRLNTVDTPNLVNIRKWYLDEAKRVNDEHLEMAEIVHAFVKAGFDPVSHLAGLGE